MDKVYQPLVLEKTEEIIEILTESNFFKDYEIDDLTYSRIFLNDRLTEKFIKGEIDETEEIALNYFDEDEFGEVIRSIIAGSVLYELKEKGYVGSYEDDNTEETFFLTKEGKDYLNNNFTEI